MIVVDRAYPTTKEILKSTKLLHEQILPLSPNNGHTTNECETLKDKIEEII